jgi:hypothetical protein
MEIATPEKHRLAMTLNLVICETSYFARTPLKCVTHKMIKNRGKSAFICKNLRPI